MNTIQLVQKTWNENPVLVTAIRQVNETQKVINEVFNKSGMFQVLAQLQEVSERLKEYNNVHAFVFDQNYEVSEITFKDSDKNDAEKYSYNANVDRTNRVATSSLDYDPSCTIIMNFRDCLIYRHGDDPQTKGKTFNPNDMIWKLLIILSQKNNYERTGVLLKTVGSKTKESIREKVKMIRRHLKQLGVGIDPIQGKPGMGYRKSPQLVIITIG